MADIWDLADRPSRGTGSIWDLADRPGGTPVGPRQAKDIGDAIIAGLQGSSGGLALRGKTPDQQLGEDAPWYHRAAAGIGGIAGDLPAMIVGGVAGIVGGGAVGSAVPVIGTAAGAAVGGAAGAFAAPMALREGLIEAYANNNAASWEGVWEIAKASMKGGAKGAVIGAATGGAGRVVAPFVAGSGAAVKFAAPLAAELGALTTTAAAVEGHLPTAQDFMDNAILLGGLKGAVAVAKGLRGSFATTGKTPEQVLADAAKDPTIKADLEAGKVPAAYEPIVTEQKIKAAILDSLDKDPRPAALLDALKPSELTNTPKLNGNILTDPVKYEYITDNATAKGVLRAVTEVYDTAIKEQTRGVVPNKQTAIEGLRAIAGGNIGERVIGEAGNAAEIYARAHMLKGASNHAIAELKKISGLPEAELTPQAKLTALAALERVAMLKAELEGVGAEAGRALQIFRQMKRDPSFLGEAEYLLKAAERKGSLQELASMADSFKDPAQLAKFAREYTKATTWEKVIEGWKAAILSGPQTHLANILGNVTKWGIEVPESMVSATLTAAQRKLAGDPLTMAQYKARALAPIIGLQLGAKDALTIAGEVLRQKGSHLEKADVFRVAIEGTKGEVIRTPFRMLQAADAIFRTPAERGKAYELAVDRLAKEKIHPETPEGRALITEYMAHPEKGLTAEAGQKAVQKVLDAGAEAVFAQRLGPNLELAQRAMKGTPLEMIIPFVRTPANLVSWAVQHTPGLNLLSSRWRNDFAAGGEARNKALARVVIGSGLAVTAYSMAQNGELTGGGMFDKDIGGTKRAAGWQAYSVKIGDKYYSYQRIEPVAKVLGIAADLIEMMKATDSEEDRAKMGSMLVLLFGNATISTTYLSGLANAVQSIADPTRYGGNFLEQYASSVVPKIVGQTVAAVDPYKREVDGVMDAVQSQLPFLREKLLPKRDVWGEPSKNGKWFDVMPIATSEISKDKVKTEAVRLQVAISDAPKYVVEKGPFKPGDKRTELTGEQRDIFKDVAGKNAMALLGPIVNAPDWERIPAFAQAEIYKLVITGARKQGQFAALPPDEPSRVKLREKIVDRITKETSEAATPARRVKATE